MFNQLQHYWISNPDYRQIILQQVQILGQKCQHEEIDELVEDIIAVAFFREVPELVVYAYMRPQHEIVANKWQQETDALAFSNATTMTQTCVVLGQLAPLQPPAALERPITLLIKELTVKIAIEEKYELLGILIHNYFMRQQAIDIDLLTKMLSLCKSLNQPIYQKQCMYLLQPLILSPRLLLQLPQAMTVILSIMQILSTLYLTNNQNEAIDGFYLEVATTCYSDPALRKQIKSYLALNSRKAPILQLTLDMQDSIINHEHVLSQRYDY